MDTQQMEEQFNRIAEEYDVNRRKFIPCFDEYYEKTTAFAASGLKPPRRILDLGAGTGLLSMYYYRHFPRAEYVLADIAEAMLEVARRRFAGMPNVKFETADYTRGLPGGDFDLIVSALSVHHLETEQKAELFSRIHERLPEGGCFVNYDQFCADTPEGAAGSTGTGSHSCTAAVFPKRILPDGGNGANSIGNVLFPKNLPC